MVLIEYIQKAPSNQFNIYKCSNSKIFQSVITYMPTKSKYNPFRIPFSSQIADEHRLATSSGVPTESSQRCPCCLMPIKLDQLTINFSLDDLKHLGGHYRGLYQYCKIMGIILLIVLFDSGIPQFQDILMSITDMSQLLSNNWSSLSPTYTYSRFIIYSTLSFVTLTFLLFAVRLLQTHRSSQLKDQNIISQEQWSVLLKNVPKSINVEQKIRDLFKTNFDNVHIREIVFISNMDEYCQIKDQIHKQVDQWRQLLKNENKKKEQILTMLKKIESSHKKLDQFKQVACASKNQHFSGNAIIVFESKESQAEVLKAWKSKFFTKNKVEASFGQTNLNDSEIMEIEPAPSPSEINWENICLPSKFHKAKTGLNYILLTFVQVDFFLFYFVSQLCIGRKIGLSYSSNSGTICSLVFLSILSFTLLPWILELMQSKQRIPTATKQYISRTKKFCFELLALKSISIFAVESVFTPNAEMAHSTLKKMIILSVFDCIISLLLCLINFQDLFKSAKKRIYGGKNQMTQQQANQMWQRPSHQIAYKFGFQISCFWSGIMLLNCAPIVTAIQFVTLFIFYWIDKLNLARRSSVSHVRISSNYMFDILGLIQIALVLKPLTNLILWSTANQKLAIQQIVMLVLAIAYNVAPKATLSRKVLTVLKLSTQEKLVENQYSEQLMDTLYRIENPITGGLQCKLNFLQDCKGIKVILSDQQAKNESRSFVISDTVQDRINLPNEEPLPSKCTQPQQEVETDRRMAETS